MSYRFTYWCPECNKMTSDIMADNRNPFPQLKCGDCLWNKVEIVPMELITIEGPNGKETIRDHFE